MKKNGKLLNWKEIKDCCRGVADEISGIYKTAKTPEGLYPSIYHDYPAIRRVNRNIALKIAFRFLEAQENKQKAGAN